ncbi:TPA: hypothetical protein DF272_02765 [Candidatus Falkowbacteria bacterium]|nr:hypothetical protein [Candidatus Falkowbacteria bacterium]
MTKKNIFNLVGVVGILIFLAGTGIFIFGQSAKQASWINESAVKTEAEIIMSRSDICSSGRYHRDCFDIDIMFVPNGYEEPLLVTLDEEYEEPTRDVIEVYYNQNDPNQVVWHLPIDRPVLNFMAGFSPVLIVLGLFGYIYSLVKVRQIDRQTSPTSPTHGRSERN